VRTYHEFSPPPSFFPPHTLLFINPFFCTSISVHYEFLYGKSERSAHKTRRTSLNEFSRDLQCLFAQSSYAFLSHGPYFPFPEAQMCLNSEFTTHHPSVRSVILVVAHHLIPLLTRRFPDHPDWPRFSLFPDPPIVLCTNLTPAACCSGLRRETSVYKSFVGFSTLLPRSISTPLHSPRSS